MIAIIQALAALFPIISKLIDMFRETPESARKALIERVQVNLAAIHDAVNLARTTKGDTSAIEKIIRGS